MTTVKRFYDRGMRILFLLCACVSILSVALICIFLFSQGLPTIAEIGVFRFLFGTDWRPTQGQFGILPMIVGSIYVTVGAILIGVPLGLLSALFLAKFCPRRLYNLLMPAVRLLAGIPSVIYGFFGLTVLVPTLQALFGGSGKNILTASVLLGIMILPTVIAVSVSAFEAVPNSYFEGSLALGATRERSVCCVTLPAAASGVSAGIILGIGRAMGEALAVSMIAGNQPVIPNSLLSGVRTLTANIVVEMGYAEGRHKDALIATAVILFVLILCINLAFSHLKRKDATT